MWPPTCNVPIIGPPGLWMVSCPPVVLCRPPLYGESKVAVLCCTVLYCELYSGGESVEYHCRCVGPCETQGPVTVVMWMPDHLDSDTAPVAVLFTSRKFEASISKGTLPKVYLFLCFICPLHIFLSILCSKYIIYYSEGTYLKMKIYLFLLFYDKPVFLHKFKFKCKPKIRSSC